MNFKQRVKFTPHSIFFILFLTFGCSVDDAIINNYFFGDSIIQRWDLKSYYPLENVTNLGESGAKINDVRNSLVNPKNKDDKCFVLAGTNDCIEKTNSGLGEEIIYNEFINDYEGLISSLQSRFKRIYIISLLPLGKSFAPEQKYFKSLYPAINSWFESRLSNEQNIKFIDVYELFINSDNNLSETFSQDGLHLNSNGYSLLSSIIREYLD